MKTALRPCIQIISAAGIFSLQTQFSRQNDETKNKLGQIFWPEAFVISKHHCPEYAGFFQPRAKTSFRPPETPKVPCMPIATVYGPQAR